MEALFWTTMLAKKFNNLTKNEMDTLQRDEII